MQRSNIWIGYQSNPDSKSWLCISDNEQNCTQATQFNAALCQTLYNVEAGRTFVLRAVETFELRSVASNSFSIKVLILIQLIYIFLYSFLIYYFANNVVLHYIKSFPQWRIWLTISTLTYASTQYHQIAKAKVSAQNQIKVGLVHLQHQMSQLWSGWKKIFPRTTVYSIIITIFTTSNRKEWHVTFTWFIENIWEK